MSLKRHSDELDFATDIPTTAEDVEALRNAARRPSGLPGWREVEILVAALPPVAKRQSRKTHEGFPPFEL